MTVIYDRVLSTAEIEEHYRLGVKSWKFGDVLTWKNPKDVDPPMQPFMFIDAAYDRPGLITILALHNANGFHAGETYAWHNEDFRLVGEKEPTTYREVVLADNPVAYWPLGEKSE